MDPLVPEPSGQPSEEDIPAALRRGAVVVIAALAGAAGGLLGALAGWAVAAMVG